MLGYLVPSKARRELLRLLWLESRSGSISHLARSARLSFAAAHRELEGMRAAGIAECTRDGRRLVYRASLGHRNAALLRDLAGLTSSDEKLSQSDESHQGQVRSWLRALGAPLGAAPPGDPLPAIEQVVAFGLALAHVDATVARVLPVVLWRQRGMLDHERLAHEATNRNEQQALGFFLELTGRLGHDTRLTQAARRLRDRRRSRLRPFFARPHGPRELALARTRTPALARKWGYVMNMGLDSFAAAFSKHAGVA